MPSIDAYNAKVAKRIAADDKHTMVVPDATSLAAWKKALANVEADVIITGTPGGVGAFRKPPVRMKAGDTIEVEISGIGTLRNPIEDEKVS